MNRMGLSLQHLVLYADEGEDMLNRIVTGDESCMQHYQPGPMQWKYPSSPLTRKFKATSSPEKVILSVLWDYQGVLLVHSGTW
jgi:hypothetical protein